MDIISNVIAIVILLAANDFLSHIVAGEQIPKTLAIRKAESVHSGPLTLFASNIWLCFH
jgi:CBS domain containing-hemolysin-like protein